MLLEVCFWLGTACVLYPYVAYPLLLAGLARLRTAPRKRDQPWSGSVSVVLAAYNEAGSIARRVQQFLNHIAVSGHQGEVVVVSDGSSDTTAAIARTFIGDSVRVLELPANQGKAAALSAGCAAAQHEVLVFADARQTWAEDALTRLIQNFADPEIGAVSGNLVLETGPGVAAGVGLYWRFEKWLRQTESRVHSMVGVTGAICAVRRELFQPIPAGTILDDVYWPLRVAMTGFRVVHDSQARAFDQLPPRARDEFRRKVRTLSGNWQLLIRLPAALLPWRNPLWWQYVSHKLSRLLAPWGLLGMLVFSALVPSWWYQAAFVGQVLGYVLGIAGLSRAVSSRFRLAAAAASFVVLNAAAWISFWVWISGRAGKSWSKVSYADPLPNSSEDLVVLPAVCGIVASGNGEGAS